MGGKERGPRRKWKPRPDLNAPRPWPIYGLSVGDNGRVSDTNGQDMDPIGRRPVSASSTRKSARNRNVH